MLLLALPSGATPNWWDILSRAKETEETQHLKEKESTVGWLSFFPPPEKATMKQHSETRRLGLYYSAKPLTISHFIATLHKNFWSIRLILNIKKKLTLGNYYFYFKPSQLSKDAETEEETVVISHTDKAKRHLHRFLKRPETNTVQRWISLWYHKLSTKWKQTNKKKTQEKHTCC